MNMAKQVVTLVAAASLFGCATMAVTSDHDPNANFTGLKTYTWLPKPEGDGADPQHGNPLMDAYIRKSIENALAAKGYTPVSGTADFQIGYHASRADKQSVQAVNTYYGYGRGWYGPGMMAPRVATTQVYEYVEGTLIIDIVDPAARKLIWRGSAQAELNRNPSTEEKQHNVDAAVEKILKQFPPEASM